mmetsp:Transcript_31230/g.73569  ORF Transcript_31230/g.73569 Transcript_31230/m.73569 type:complete len:123 (+) Transcript_31230:736-1104(+)
MAAMIEVMGVAVGTMTRVAIGITNGGVIPIGDIAMKSIVGEDGLNLAEGITAMMITEEDTIVVAEDIAMVTTVGEETATVAVDTVVMTEALAVAQRYLRVMISMKKCEDENELMSQLEGIKP